jgi:hypothetical protein
VVKKIKNKKTVGEQYLDVALKLPESRDPIELQREMQKGYIEELGKCVIEFRKTCQTDFWVVVLIKRERLMENVLRFYYFARHSCPTPDFDQSVYFYDSKDESLSFIWAIPDKETCRHLRNNALYIHDSEKQLLQFVLEFFDGTLFEKAKRFNKEVKNSPLIAH